MAGVKVQCLARMHVRLQLAAQVVLAAGNQVSPLRSLSLGPVEMTGAFIVPREIPQPAEVRRLSE